MATVKGRYGERATKAAASRGRRPMLLALEPRIMFDGAAVADAAETLAPASAVDAVEASHPAPVEIRAADPSRNSGKTEVAFIDTSVADWMTLVQGVRAGVEVQLIDGGQSGLGQMAQWAETHSGYDAIHILGHGSEGEIRLGRDTLNTDSLSGDVVKQDLATLGQSLTSDGDLLLYACDVAAGAEGLAFLGNLADATGADVAASDDPTGATALGGDWILEARQGAIETSAVSVTDFDGVLATSMTKDINPIGASNPTNMVKIGSEVFFVAYNGISAGDLWKTDGTAAGTVMVKDINPTNNQSGGARNLTDVNGTLFFTADNGTDGMALWKSDGTEAGTVMVKDINPSGNPNFQDLTNVNGTLFFSASNGTDGQELWKSDGTDAGTVMVKDIYSGATGSDPDNLTNVNGTLFFAARDSSNGTELWRSDGTEGGTFMVQDIHSSGSSNPGDFLNLNGTLYFSAYNPTSGREMWASQGFSANLVKEFAPGASNGNPTNLIEGNMGLFFTVNDGTHGTELWTSDGTDAGTKMVKDINPGGNTAFSDFILWNGTLFFSANDGTNGAELWKSDGTEAGTVMVKDINSGSGSSSPGGMVVMNDTLFFAADDGPHGFELWKSDGTEAGTIMVADINSGSGDARNYPSLFELTALNGTLVFAATDGGTGGVELWSSDGMPGPTVTAANITITSTGSGPGGAYRAGDRVEAVWNNAGSGDNQSGITSVTMDFSAFGGGSAVIASNSGADFWTARYTIAAGTIDTSIANVSVSATDAAGTTTTADTTNLTVDNKAPTLSSSTPADNGTNFAPSANIVLTFSENIAKGTGNIVIRKTSDDSVVETIDVTSGLVTVSDDKVTINPNTTLADMTGYYVQIGAGAITDVYGHAYAGISDTTSLSFTSGDGTAPLLSSSTPADNATSVGPNADIVLTFNETVAKGTGNIVIKAASDNSTVETIDVTSGLVTLSGAQVTINPSTTLDFGTAYYVQIDAGAITDTSANGYAGINDTTTLSFTTGGPTVTGVTGVNGAYKAGDTVDITVTFESAVDVTTAGGTPSLALATGGTATYLSGSGTSALVFRYTVADGHNSADLDYSGATSLALNGGTITAHGGSTAATLTLPTPGATNSLAANQAIVIDTTAPRVTSIDRQTPSGATTNADTLIYRVTFDGAMSNVDAADFTVTGSTATVTNVTSAGGNAYDVTLSGGDLAGLDGTVTLGFDGGQNITDTAGNALTSTTPTGTNNATYTVDNTPPRVTSIDRQTPSGATTNADSLVYRVTFDGAVSNLDATDFTVSGTTATVTNVASAGGNAYDVTLSGGDLATLNGTVTLGFAGGQDITDAAGNALTSTTPSGTNNVSYTVDNTAPRVTSIDRQTPSGATTNADTLVYRVTFDGAVSNLDANDFTVSGTTATVTNVAAAGGNAYDVTLSGGDLANFNGTVTLGFASGQDVSDAAGNALNTTPSGTNNTTYTVDNTAPRVTSIDRQTPSGASTNADSLVYRVTFDGAVSNLDVTDFTVSGTTATVTSVASAGGNAYDVTLSGGDLATLNGTVTLGFASGQNVTDAAGNALTTTPTGTNNSTYTVDNTAPGVVSIDRQTPSGATTNADSLVYRATFDGAVSNLDATDFTVYGTTATVTSVVSAGGNAYDVTVSGGDLANLNGTVTLGPASGHNVTDAAGNALNTTPTGTSNNTYTVDNTAPRVTSIDRQTPSDATTNADTLVYRVTFDGAVSNLDAADFTVSGTTATVTNVASAGGNAYDITVSGGNLGNLEGTVTLGFASGQNVTDAAGNALNTTPTGTNTTTYTVDTIAPRVTSIDRQTPSGAATNADSLVYRVTFDGAVSNLDAADFTVSGTTATVTSVASAGGNAYDVTLSGGDLATLNGTVTLGFASGQNVTDAAGNALNTTPTGTNNTSYTVDNIAPRVTSIDRQTPSGASTNADSLVYRVTFDGAVSNLDAADFTVSGSTATVTKVIAAGGNAYDVTLSGGDLANFNGTVTLGFASGQDVSDAAGNALNTTPSGTNNSTYTVDNSAPTQPSVDVVGNVTSTPVSITGTAEPNATIDVYNGEELLGTVVADENGEWSYSAALAIGRHSITTTATDAAGNTGTPSAPMTVTVSSPPSSLPPAPTSSPAQSTPAAPTVGTGAGALSTVVRTGESDGFGLPPGPNLVGATAVDVEGFRVVNVSSLDAPLVTIRPLSVIETTGSVIRFTLPSDIFASSRPNTVVTLMATLPDGGALPSWLFFDQQTGTFVGQPPSGMAGEIAVRIVARDQNGNEAVATIRININGEAATQPQAGGQPGGEGPQAPGQQGELTPETTDPVIKLADFSNGQTVAGKQTFQDQLQMASRLSGTRQAQLLAAARAVARNA